MIVFAHLSDTHLDGSARSAERTRAVMDHLNALPYDLDAVLVTGDIADTGLSAEYDEARTLLESRHPVLVLPGNHDVRGPFRETLLGEAAADGPINRVHRTDRAVYALCDSSIPGRPDGLLADETLSWLTEVLDEAPPSVPVFVAFHHPPVELGVPDLDRIRQFDAERLAAVVADRPNVVGLLCGHAHTPAATVFAGKPLIVAPGVVSTINLPCERADENAPFVDPLIPPAFAFHMLDDSGRLTTHYRVVV
ncbi:metallophosphoesterase [Embleya sp. NBC_00896]|uniref:metallophosphoesterase n=1 Tax=Embleya sp. NBC_00896 TaxID=2975961 RepID=UPI002F90CD45|nr:metallophosphoesterase [Embleya sp. NBC_00896]